ncbi:MAG: signal peptide peptidase SppA [Candidatus Methanospirareceae archaeon]
MGRVRRTSILLALVIVVIAILVTLIISFALPGKERFNGNKIVIIEIKGELKEEGVHGVTTPRQVRDLLEKAERDVKVKAIVLSINSPGGEAGASWEIYRDVERVEKPVVAFIGNTGASGAYLVAIAADKIVATPLSVVGSIGASVEFPFDVPANLSKEPEKISSLGSGEFKDIFADYRLNESEKRYLEERLASVVDVFLRYVAENRNMSMEEVKKLAHGGWFTGEEALHLGLIDKLGNLEDALEEAASLVNISLEDTRVVILQMKDGRIEEEEY